MHVFLVIAVVIYASIGGLFFEFFEAEDRERAVIRELSNINLCIAKVLNSSNETTSIQWMSTSILTDCVSKYLEELEHWTYQKSALYSFTVMTTVGEEIIHNLLQ